MKKAILGLAALAVSSCASTFNGSVITTKPLEERVIEEGIEGRTTLSKAGIHVLNVDGSLDGEYLTPSGVAYVDKALQEKTDCRLSVYFDRYKGYLGYLVEKGNTGAITGMFLYEPRYVKLYPYDFK